MNRRHFVLWILGATVYAGEAVLPAAPVPTRPDQLLFLSWRPVRGQIVVLRADGSGAENLTPKELLSETSACVEPAWSPDGRKITFRYGPHTGDGSTIYVMNADGSGLTRLTDGNLNLNPL